MVNWDSALGYNTAKIVTIKDARLGLLHYGFMLAIIAYILVFTVLMEQRYLLTERPVGSIRMSLLKGKTPVPLQDMEYCWLPNRTALPNGEPIFPCEYQDELFVVFPVTEATAMFATSRYTYMEQTLTCSLLTDPTCAFNTTYSSVNFVADIEHFTMMIDHTFYAPNVGVQRNAKALPGRMLYANGSTMDLAGPPNNVIGKEGYADIIELQTLLTAAGISSLDRLIGKFDFQVTLLTFVSGLGLITVSTVVVDLIAIYLLPQKKRYQELKYKRAEGYHSRCFGGSINSDDGETVPIVPRSKAKV